MSTLHHTEFMSLALQEAQRGRYTVAPNPMVGCLIVKNNHIIGIGFHHHAGGPHAEIIALQQAGQEARGATAFVTLEPCCHYGKTPPCTIALIKSGIAKIYVACEDPNPLVAGKGIEQLQSAGIQIEIGLLAAEATKLNEIFFHYIKHNRPFVFAKWAMSLDGKTITHIDDSRDISCLESRQDSHLLRQQVDAILIGANTAINDNPLLTARYNNISSKQPVRIILSSDGKLPLNLKLFDPSLSAKTIVATTNQVDPKWVHEMDKMNIEILILPMNDYAQVDIPTLLDVLGTKQITSLLVEGGMTVHHSFFNQNLVNKIHVYLAPVIIGSTKNKRLLHNITLSRIAKDFHFTADNEDK